MVSLFTDIVRLKALTASRRDEKYVVDLFAGGGGASYGIEAALKRAVDRSCNHDPMAVEMHAANHPDSKHYCADVWEAEPEDVITDARGNQREVGLAWFSPDCRHFSRAKGGKPVSKRVRGLAWVVVKWAKRVRPEVIILENVREFADWGPLVHARGEAPSKHELLTTELRGSDKRKFAQGYLYDSSGRPVMMPDHTKKGQTFRRWVAMLRNLGYTVEWRPLNAADYGAPTHRKRLFLVARCDGKPIKWPEPTHGPTRAHPYRMAAECIDWSDLGKSIFDRDKPLAEKTLSRIVRGFDRYVLKNAHPFILQVANGSNPCGVRDVAEPMNTVTARPKGGAMAVVSPLLVDVNHGASSKNDVRAKPVNEPGKTITGSHGTALATPILTHFRGSNKGNAGDVSQPMPSVTAQGNHIGAVVPFLTKFRQNSIGTAATEPMPTIASGSGAKRPAGAAHALGLVAPLLTHNYGEAPHQKTRGQKVDGPINTITPNNNTGNLIVAPLIASTAHTGTTGRGKYVDEPVDPLKTITSANDKAVVSAFIAGVGGRAGQTPPTAADAPLGTITAKNDRALVAPWFTCYYGAEGEVGSRADAPMRTVTSKDRVAMVSALFRRFGVDAGDIPTVTINGEQYVVADIFMRMLTPRELARAQGFPEDYVLTGSKANQVAKIGNSVCPIMAKVLVESNCQHLVREKKAKALKTVPIHARLPESDVAQVDKAAEQELCSRSNMLARIVRDWVKRQLSPKKRS